MDFGAASKSLGFDLGPIVDPQTKQIAVPISPAASPTGTVRNE